MQTQASRPPTDADSTRDDPAKVLSARRRRLEHGIGLAALIGVAATLTLGLAVAPPDAVQGEPQRLMYVHVPAAWTAYLSFGIVLVASIGYLARGDLRWDARAQAAAELGVGLTGLTLVAGMLWGRPVWGVWWVWDPRLVSTAFLLLIYAGYLGVRGLTDDPHVTARRAAVIGIIGFADIPIVHFSVVWWRTLHQPPTLLRPEGSPPMPASMLVALLAGLVTFTLLAGWVYLRRLDALTLAAAHDAEPAEAHPPAATVPVRITRGGRS